MAVSDIHLQEIYCAIEDRKAFHLHVSEIDDEKKISQFVNNYFLDLFAEIQVEIEDKMKKLTLFEIVNQLQESNN